MLRFKALLTIVGLTCLAVAAQSMEKSSTEGVMRVFYDKDLRKEVVKEFAAYSGVVYLDSLKREGKIRLKDEQNGKLYLEGDFDTDYLDTLSFESFTHLVVYYPSGLKALEKERKNGLITSTEWNEEGKTSGHFELKQINPDTETGAVYHGTCISYYNNGQPEQYGEFVDGELQGMMINYLENGHIKDAASYKMGKLDGLSYQFDDEKHTCIQIEWKDGEISKPYYSFVNKDGYVSKYKVKDNTLFFDIPLLADIQYMTDGNGWNWSVYNKNGIAVAIHTSISGEYGTYYRLYLVVTNNTAIPINFDPSYITAHCKDKGGKEQNLRVLNASEYQDRIWQTQVWEQGFNTLAENYRAKQAAYSASQTNTTTGHVGVARAAEVGSAGWSIGASAYAGLSQTSSTTVSYDGYAAYQASLIAEKRIADFNQQLFNERKANYQAYLKPITLQPGESVTGFINVSHKKGEMLMVNVPISTVIYPFKWNISNQK